MFDENLVKPIANRALFIDMNSFFASVEQQVDPSLRGRPVAVVPFIYDGTSVLAASVEAKRLGIGTGTPVHVARKLCPDIVLMKPNAPLYRQYHRAVMAMLRDTRCQVVVKSIDEALLTVPGDLRPHAEELASEIRSNVRTIGDWLGCSIGIGPNLFISKMASNAQKPNGLVVVGPDELEGFYATLRLKDLYGVARRNSRRLARLGLDSPLAFYQASLPFLRQHFGEHQGAQWYLRLHGIEVDIHTSNRYSVGHQMTLTPNPARSYEELWPTASQLIAKVSRRLRADNLTSHSLVAFVRYTNRTFWQAIGDHHGYANDLPTLMTEASRLFKRLPYPAPARLIGVSAINLVPSTAIPYSLFPEERRAEMIGSAVENINERYGAETITSGRNLNQAKVADHIGFGNAPDVAQLKS